MFEKSVEELTELGAQITTAEIAQQPELWRDTLNIYRENKEAIEAFLAEARAMGEGRLSVVFTGAGTSDYVGDTCAPYLRHAGNTDLYDFKPIATTDIVSAPRDFLRAEDPTLVVSFARSGNSPESLAAVAVAIIVTAAPVAVAAFTVVVAAALVAAALPVAGDHPAHQQHTGPWGGAGAHRNCCISH